MSIDFSKVQAVAPLTEPIHIVVSVAHHDDIEFGVAGSVARWIEEGATVTYIVITDGGSGNNNVGAIRSDTVETRRREQLAAAKELGVTDVRFLGYHDGMLEPTMELRRDITRIIRELKPYRVVIQDPTTKFVRGSYINHPDHRAAGEASLYAVFPSSESRPIFPELLAEGLEPHKVGELFMNLTLKPTHFMDISSTIEHKMASLSHHVSQIGEGEDAANGALKWVRAGSAEGGSKVGVQYAEFFRVMKLDQTIEERLEEESDQDS